MTQIRRKINRPKMTQVELTEMKNTAPMKNTPDGIKSRLDTAKEKVSELEDIAIEIIQNE